MKNFMRFIDQNGDTLNLGDIVNVTKGRFAGDAKWIFVFCIPQHRFGFVTKDSYDRRKKANDNGEYAPINVVPEPFVLDYPHLNFYWTPKSSTTILKRPSTIIKLLNQ